MEKKRVSHPTVPFDEDLRPAVNFTRQEADIILDIVRDTLDKRTEGDESSPWS